MEAHAGQELEGVLEHDWHQQALLVLQTLELHQAERYAKQHVLNYIDGSAELNFPSATCPGPSLEGLEGWMRSFR